MADIAEVLRANPVAKLLTQIEQNTRSDKTAVYYKNRQDLGAKRVSLRFCLYFYQNILEIHRKVFWNEDGYNIMNVAPKYLSKLLCSSIF